MPFFVSTVDPRVTAGAELMLSPGPTEVDYAPGALGSRVQTDSRVIVQQPAQDTRVRTWMWRNYPSYLATYEEQFWLLRGLRSRERQESGLSPYVWLRETETNEFSRLVQANYLVQSSSSTASVLNLTTGPFTSGTIAKGTVEVAPASVGGTGTGQFQRRSIAGNTTNQLTVRPAFTTIPHGALITVRYWVNDWFKARIIDVDRKLDGTGNVRFSETWLTFAIEDTAWNDLG